MLRVANLGVEPAAPFGVSATLRDAVAGFAGELNGNLRCAFLCVNDDGPGVPPDQRRAIFDAGVALRAGGSGQGLALVRQVIEGEMAGSVACGDSPLGGARFEIVIPLRRGRTP